MDFHRPLLAVTPTLDGDVLAALAYAEEEFSGRQLARLVGRGSAEGIRRAADRLAAQGVVHRRSVGAANLYRLNRDHLAAPWIEGLASLREQLVDRLREEIASWETRPMVALLFGSAARGEATTRSDIDLLMVRSAGCDPDSEPWQTEILTLQQRVTAWTGNDGRVLQYGEHELSGQGPAEPVVEHALNDGIELFGAKRTLRGLLDRGAQR